MIDIQAFFYDKIKGIISEWSEEGIYAISFFVYANEGIAYKGINNATEFSISYNTETDCPGVGPFDEERWNYAFWRQDTVGIVDPSAENDGAELLFQWYDENGIENVGYEDIDYDKQYLNGEYIGKGPIGFYELLTIAAEIARKMQDEGFILNHFGKPVPIIVHGLEYAWHDIEATKRANPKGEAEDFLQYVASY